MNREREPQRLTRRAARRLVVASVIAVGMTAAFLPGSGIGASGGALRDARLDISFGRGESVSSRPGASAAKFTFHAVPHPSLGGRVVMSADGTTALVSAIGVGVDKGAVYVYHVADAGSWTSSSTPVATLNAGGAHNLLGRGLALSADGTTAFVGAPYHAAGAGAVFVFHVASEDGWASTSTPTANLTVNGGLFTGVTLAASADGTTVVVGAPYANSYSGGAYIFHAASEDAWVSSSTPTAILTNAGQSTSDEGVGGVVAMSSDGTTTLLSDTNAGEAAGAAYIFHVASEDGWATSSAPTAILTNVSYVPGSYLSDSLALSGDGTTAFLGAAGVNRERGAVDVYHATGEDAWASSSTPTAVLTNALGKKGDFLGAFVRASGDGLTVVATATGTAKATGAAQIFHVADESTWTSSTAPTATLTDSARVHGDLLGAGLAVSADGATVLVGAPGVNWSTGVADVFHVSDAASWLTGSTPAAALTNSALPAPVCIVPPIVGLPVVIAKLFLADSDCRLGRVKRVHSKLKKLPRGAIVSESPAPGKHLAAGSKVRVHVKR
jgi:hypothetical protein